MSLLATLPAVFKDIDMAQKATPTIPESLRTFDDLPDSSHVRQPTVEALFGISAATVWRMVNRGQLKTHKFSERITTFNVGEIRALLNAKKAADSRGMDRSPLPWRIVSMIDVRAPAALSSEIPKMHQPAPLNAPAKGGTQTATPFEKTHPT